MINLKFYVAEKRHLETAMDLEHEISQIYISARATERCDVWLLRDQSNGGGFHRLVCPSGKQIHICKSNKGLQSSIFQFLNNYMLAKVMNVQFSI